MSGNKKRAYSLRMTPGPSGWGSKWGQSTRSVKLLQTTETGNCFYSKCLDNFMQCSLLREVDSADDDKKKRTFVKQTQALKESLLDRVKI